MLKSFFYLVFILSLSIAGIRVFHLDTLIITEIEKLQTPEAKEQEEEIIPVQKTFSASEHIQRGDSYLKQGFAELSRDEYLAAIQQNPNDFDSFLKLAKTQTLLKNYQGAISNLKSAAGIKNSEELQMALARNLIHLGDLENAKSRLALVKNLRLEADTLLLILSFLEENTETNNKQNFSQIIKDIEEKIQASQSTSENNYAKEFTNEFENIAAAFKQFDLYKGSQEIFLKTLVAKALVENKAFELAQTLLNKILAERSDYRDAWILQGYVYLNLEEYEEAKKAYNFAYDLDPTKPETQYFLAVAYQETGDKQKAFEFFQLAYKNHYQPQIHVVQKLAELSLEFADYQQASELYEKYLELSHTEVDSFIRPISIAINNLNNLEKAEQLAEWARNLFPEKAQSYNLLAWVEIEKNNLDTAQSYILQALQFDPNFAAAHFNQGRIYLLEGNKQAALQSYETAYQNNKDGPIGTLAAEKYNELLK